jgi:hypothetical protein
MIRRLLLNRLLLAIALLALPMLACDASSLTSLVAKPPTSAPAPIPQPTVVTVINIVTNAVTAKNITGDTFDPSGITDSFPSDQNIFHTVVTIANAPADTKIKVAWLTADKSSMGEYEIASEGSRNLDFTFKPDAGKLPAGNYAVQVYVNGTLDRTLNFSVQAGTVAVKPTTAPPTAAAKPTTVPPTVAVPKPSGYVNTVTMAEGVQGDTKEPSNPTVVFKPSATFHAIVRTQNAPANTKFKASWYAVDIGSAAPPNSLIDETELATDGSRNIDFTLAPQTVWPVGAYRIEIAVNGVLDTVKTFNVK